MRGWSKAEVSRHFLVSDDTIREWLRRADDDSLVQTQSPVNRFPDFVRYTVQQIKLYCPTLGKVKIADKLARAGIHIGKSTVERILKERPQNRRIQPMTMQTSRVVSYRSIPVKELMTSIYTAMKAADPACQLGIQVGRTHDGPMVVKRGTPGIHFWAQPYEWIIADPQPQDRSDSAGYIVDFIRSGGKTAGVEQTTYESYANEPAVFWEFTWQVWQHGAPLMLIANCTPHSDAQGVHTSRRSAEQIGNVAKVNRPMTAMFISKWELYAWDGGQRWLDLRNAYKRLTDDSKLVIDVINGDIIRNLPGLLDHYATIIVPFGDVIDEQEKAALDAHADKLVIESPQIYATTVLSR